jgi:hypothetical protein
VKTGSLDNQAWLTWAARPHEPQIHPLHPQGSQAQKAADYLHGLQPKAATGDDMREAA